MTPRTTDARSPPRLRGVPIVLARLSAVILSIGVVGLLAVQAGLAGCRSQGAEAEPERLSAPAQPGAPLKAPAAGPSGSANAAPAADKGEEGEYFPGSKAPAGGWAKRPRKE